jgi:ribosomal peptide maturation radical SAM protein 1
MARVLLVVPPFHFLDRPALGVSLLQAALARDGIPCDVFYLNLRFADFAGEEFYTAITESRYQAMLGEWVFSGDLFGERAPDPQRYVDEVLADRYCDREFGERVKELRARTPAFLDHLLDDVAWGNYAIVGATSTFQQNCPALALLQRVKTMCPNVATVMGGANCEGVMGAAIHESFPFVDYVLSGEGDVIFPRLVKAILAGQRVSRLSGVYARGELNLLGEGNHAPTVTDLDGLPYPNFDDYFSQLASSGVGPEIRPILVFETARGCWWGEKHHCTFCGLNAKGMQYRSKSARRAREELDFLLGRHENRMVHVVDNILDFGYFGSFLTELASRTFPPSFYYMTKANLTKDQLRLLARAGVRDITPGIESLSTPILRLMKKGVTELQNVRLLKWCAEVGIVPNWAFMYGFPGEDPLEYERMARLVPSLTHLQPPGGVNQVRLDRFSPNFDEAEAGGFVNVRPAEPYHHVYPLRREDLARLVWHFDFDYADGREPAGYTRALRCAIERWREQRETARLDLGGDGDILEIQDTRPSATRPRTVMRGAARLAYLALDAGSTVEAVRGELLRLLGDAAPTIETIEGWLETWLRDRLVMREGPRYLSLATNSTERVQLPIERIAAFLRGSTVPPAVVPSAVVFGNSEGKQGKQSRSDRSCTYC